jgi:AraC family transcriptional regulator of adaptative response/methylated-DNA-[protein]-cysteine methyltransferase
MKPTLKLVTHTTTRAARGKGLTLVWGLHDFALGKMLIALSAEGLCWIGLNCGEKDLAKNWPGANLVEDKKLTEKTARDIAKAWQKGWPEHAAGVSAPLVLYGTAFQIKVWKELLKIKSGQTVTYADIARKIGKPAAVRAVGSAVGKNTLSIIVPCHRVVNTSGNKISYGWGPAMKKALLKAEGAA